MKKQARKLLLPLAAVAVVSAGAASAQSAPPSGITWDATPVKTEVAAQLGSNAPTIFILLGISTGAAMLFANLRRARR